MRTDLSWTPLCCTRRATALRARECMKTLHWLDGEQLPGRDHQPDLATLISDLDQDRAWLLQQIDSGRWPELRLLAALERELGQLLVRAVQNAWRACRPPDRSAPSSEGDVVGVRHRRDTVPLGCFRAGAAAAGGRRTGAGAAWRWPCRAMRCSALERHPGVARGAAAPAG